MIEAALIEILGNDSAILAIIGDKSQIAIAGDGQARAYPKLVIDVVERRYHKHSTGILSLRGVQLKLHCWSERPQAASLLADAVEGCLFGYVGCSAGVCISGVFPDKRFSRQQELEGKVAGKKDTLFCQTILSDINCTKQGN